MNRIQLAAPPAQNSPQPSPQTEQALITASRQRGFPHTFFVPLHYERNYAYPLLVWLHGPADDERQLQRIMPLVSMRNYVAVSPRGACQIENGSRGYRWRQTETCISAAEQSVFDCIDAASERFNISSKRIFLAGYQCGGTMAFRVALRNSQSFAGVLSVGGPFPSGHSPLLNLQQTRGLPLFIAHGRDAEMYTVERTCEELRLFHAAGLSVTLRQYPCGDELTTQMLHDMDVWIMEHVTGTAMTNNDDAPARHESN